MATGRRRLRMALGVVAALVAVATAAALVLIVMNRPDTSFGFALPLAVTGSACKPAAGVAGTDVVVSCTPVGPAGFTSAEFRLYSGPVALQDDFRSSAAEHDLQTDRIDRCAVEPMIVGSWSEEDGVSKGTLACFLSASGSAEIIWTDSTVPAMGLISRTDGNAEALWQWWRDRNVHLSPFGSSGL